MQRKKLTRISQRSPQLAEEREPHQPDWLLFRKKVDTTTNYKINSEISSEIDKKQKKILRLVFETLSEYLSREMVEIIYNGIMGKIQEKRR